MPAVIESANLISQTMDSLIDFIVTDESLGKEFENYLIKNKIEIKKETELNDILIDYILVGKIQDGTRVLDYYYEKNPDSDKNILDSIKNAYISVFKINKISKNSYDVFDLVKETEMSLIPLVKTTSLRGVGLYDYIWARIIDIEGNFYLLEIFDIIGQYREYFANIEAVKSVLKNPKIAVLGNTQKFLELKNAIASFNSSFIECFKKNEVVVSNKNADKLLNDFYLYHKGEIGKVEYEEISDGFNFEYFDIEEFNNENFLLNAVSGFSSAQHDYDIGFYSDESTGLYMIPFAGSFEHLLKENKELSEENTSLIKYFLLNDNIPPSFLIQKQKEYPNLLDLINQISTNKFQTVEEAMDFYKYEYKDGFRLSSMSVLYNLNVFSKVLGHKEEQKEKTVGRNDPCPCGSGKKYKKCCLNKTEVLR